MPSKAFTRAFTSKDPIGGFNFGNFNSVNDGFACSQDCVFRMHNGFYKTSKIRVLNLIRCNS